MAKTIQGGEVKLYLDHVLLKVQNVSDEYLESVAYQLEAQTKVRIQQNGQIDTGFMLNSTYVVSRRSNSYRQANADGTYIDRNDASVRRRLAPQASLPGNARALVAVGAEYAIYQEQRKSFLFSAGEEVARSLGGTVERKFKDMLTDA